VPELRGAESAEAAGVPVADRKQSSD
jgi:hypothetical protein